VSSPSSSAIESTPNPGDNGVDTPNGDASSVPPTKRKSLPGPKPGLKRSASQIAADAVPKPRGKPGPKKKMKIDGVNGNPLPISAPKLNPKANQGAINANLRALDRSGKPCRRWAATGFRVKSFTGIAWSAKSAWGATKHLDGDESGEEESSLASDRKGNVDSSGVMSEKSQDTPLQAGRSPAVLAV